MLYESEGFGYGTLAKMFGCVKATAQQVCGYQTWKGVPPLRVDQQRMDEIREQYAPVAKVRTRPKGAYIA